MLGSRMFTRSARSARTARTVRSPAVKGSFRHQARSESSQSANASATKAGGVSDGLIGGVAGGAIVFLAGYSYYHFSGAKTVVNTATATKKKLEGITQSMKDQTPEPSELLKWFRSTVSQYAQFIPGAKPYVDTVFNDLDKIEKNHRGEVEEIVSKAYYDLKWASKSGLTVETAQKTWEILQQALTKLGELAVDSSNEILDNHPEIKEKVGGNLDQLKSLGDSFGPEAKKLINDTSGQIKDIIAGGVGASTIPRIKELIDEKREQIQKLGEKAWSKGLEEAKPYLDKNPQLKEIITKNQDVLKSSNLSELWEKVKSNNVDDIQQYVKDASEKAKKSGAGGLGSLGKDAEKYIKLIPGGSEIIPKLQKLQEVAENHGDEAQKLLQDTYKEVSEVLRKKTAEAEKLAKKAKKETK